jgi:cell division cycle 2-like protein
LLGISRTPHWTDPPLIYSTAIDLWSVGCIFGEFLKLAPLFPGRSEPDQLERIFAVLGTPNEQVWPGCSQLPGMKHAVFVKYEFNQVFFILVFWIFFFDFYLQIIKFKS